MKLEITLIVSAILLTIMLGNTRISVPNKQVSMTAEQFVKAINN